MSQTERKEQARLEVGRTRVSSAVARALTTLFLLMVAAPPIVELGFDLTRDRRTPDESGAVAAVTQIGRGLRGALDELVRLRPVAANRRLVEAIGEAEHTLEEDSLLRRRLRPPVQLLLTALLGLGTEQSYVGRDGWLFFRPDFDYSVGRGFLDAGERERRRRDAEPRARIQPDPLPALLSFSEQLARRQIRLLVVPVPGKTVIHPGPMLPPGRAVGVPLHNPSFGVLIRSLEAAGVATHDPTADLLALAASAEPPFLRTDSHWTPRAVEQTAAAVARRLRDLAPLPETFGTQELVRRPAVLSGRGDLVTLLRLAEPDRLFAPEPVEVRRVERLDGGSWRPQRGTPVLLLGDSFTNVFSDPALGWGSGAGLAEHLAFELDRPLDRIARNAGGAHEAREELARDLASGRDRLAATRVVVYQFAVRELASGDWRLIEHD